MSSLQTSRDPIFRSCLRCRSQLALTVRMNSNIPAEELPGAILMDGLVQSFLLGTIVNQAFKYWMDSRNDSWHKRIFVTTVILLAILQTVLEDYKVWRTMISRLPWSTSPMEWSDLFLNGCICALCEAFYIRRCWKVTIAFTIAFRTPAFISLSL